MANRGKNDNANASSANSGIEAPGARTSSSAFSVKAKLWLAADYNGLIFADVYDPWRGSGGMFALPIGFYDVAPRRENSLRSLLLGSGQTFSRSNIPVQSI